MDKRHVVASIEFVANLTGEALTGSRGVRRFGGHSLRVTGARLMAGMQCCAHPIDGKGSSDVVLRYLFYKGLTLTGVSPVGAVICRECSMQKNNAVLRRRARSNSSSSFVPSGSSNSSCSSKPGSTAELWGAMGSGAFDQQL